MGPLIQGYIPPWAAEWIISILVYCIKFQKARQCLKWNSDSSSTWQADNARNSFALNWKRNGKIYFTPL